MTLIMMKSQRGRERVSKNIFMINFDRQWNERKILFPLEIHRGIRVLTEKKRSIYFEKKFQGMFPTNSVHCIGIRKIS